MRFTPRPFANKYAMIESQEVNNALLQVYPTALFLVLSYSCSL
jgi:hypothetical protein